MNDSNIILIGPMGAGKSSIGRRLAQKLLLPFKDTDQEIRRGAGVDIGFIFDKEGESGFRERETRVLRELAKGPVAVIATGGGVVLREENRRLLKDSGTVIYLETSVQWQLARTQAGKHRPLLEGVDAEQRLTALLSEREPLYLECANIIVNTDERRVASVTDLVLAHLRDAATAGNSS